jgi:DNA polymerase phi
MVRTNTQTIDSRRTWIIEQFAALIRNGAIPKKDEWVQVILDSFVVNGLFIIKRESDNNALRGVSVKP